MEEPPYWSLSWFPTSKYSLNLKDPWRLSRPGHYPLQRESNPLFRAVVNNDLEELRMLVEAGSSVNIQNAKGTTLLNFIMRRKRVKMFDYLLSLEQTDVNFENRSKQSPLIYLAGVCFDEYFALELIKRGADVHKTDQWGSSFLHLAPRSESEDTLTAGRIIIEKGVDVNLRGQEGLTPLYVACESGNVDWIYMLLYYGADPMIASYGGVLPVACCEDVPDLDLEEILLNYTFNEDEKIVMRLPTIESALRKDSLFPKLVDHISEVSYDRFDLRNMLVPLRHVRPHHLRLFIEKFGYIVKDLIDIDVMDVIIKIAHECGSYGLKDLLEVFLTCDHVEEFVQSSDITVPKIAYMLKVFHDQNQLKENREEIIEMIYLMLSYGLSVTSTDLDKVFKYFGYCELFEFLLHMDFTMMNCDQDERSMAVLYYDPHTTIDSFVDSVEKTVYLCMQLLPFYNNRQLKEFVLENTKNPRKVEKVQGWPQVPLLVQLSRDAARKFVVDTFNIEDSRQFYTFLKRLPIGEKNKRILGLIEPLY